VTDKVEKTAEAAIEVIDTVAEATEKVAGEVAHAFPGNDNLKKAASKIKAVTDAIEEDAEKAEALIKKVSLIMQYVRLRSIAYGSELMLLLLKSSCYSLASYNYLLFFVPCSVVGDTCWSVVDCSLHCNS
jgi:hypothetical protein